MIEEMAEKQVYQMFIFCARDILQFETRLKTKPAIHQLVNE